MKKIIWKRTVVFVLVVNILLSCMGCNREQESVDTKNMVYKENLLSLDDFEGEIGAITYKDGRIYFGAYQIRESYEHEENENHETENHEMEGMFETKLYSVNMDGGDLKEVPYNIDKPAEIIKIMVGENDMIYLAVDYYDDELGKNVSYFTKVDKDGKELVNVKLDEVIKAEEETNINDVVMDSSGHIVAVTDQAAYILNE